MWEKQSSSSAAAAARRRGVYTVSLQSTPGQIACDVPRPHVASPDNSGIVGRGHPEFFHRPRRALGHSFLPMRGTES